MLAQAFAESQVTVQHRHRIKIRHPEHKSVPEVKGALALFALHLATLQCLQALVSVPPALQSCHPLDRY